MFFTLTAIKTLKWLTYGAFFFVGPAATKREWEMMRFGPARG